MGFICYMILGNGIFSELQIDLCLSDNIIRRNGGNYEGCNDPIKDVSNIYFNGSSNWLNINRFWNEESW